MKQGIPFIIRIPNQRQIHKIANLALESIYKEIINYEDNNYAIRYSSNWLHYFRQMLIIESHWYKPNFFSEIPRNC